MRKTVALTLSLTIAAACSHAITGPKSVRVGAEVELLAGESARVENSAVAVLFESLNDSRCPSDVVCVHAGDAAVQLTFSGAGPEKTDAVYLARSPRAAIYGGYSFHLTSVTPYPKSTEQGAAKVARLSVTEVAP